MYHRIGLNLDSEAIQSLAITGRGVARVGAQENPQTTVDQFGDSSQDIAGCEGAENIRNHVSDLSELIFDIAL